MYLIIGGSGFLGSYMIKNILEHTQDGILSTSRSIPDYNTDNRVNWLNCDITTDKSIEFLTNMSKRHHNLKVIYLAAYHKPDLVQKHPRLAWDVNIIALAKIMNQLDNIQCFFYASTDSVYGNSIHAYHFKEEDDLKPLNIYGKQKQCAEALVTGFGYNVVRYPFLIGPSLLKSRHHFYDDIVEHLNKKESVGMFMDSYRSALDFNMAAHLLIQLAEAFDSEYPKVLNLAGDEDLSKYDIGLKIAKKVGCGSDLIKPASMNVQQGIFTAPRAISTLIDNSKVKKILGLSEIKLQL